jgi:hypothetical protein
MKIQKMLRQSLVFNKNQIGYLNNMKYQNQTFYLTVK